MLADENLKQGKEARVQKEGDWRFWRSTTYVKFDMCWNDTTPGLNMLLGGVNTEKQTL